MIAAGIGPASGESWPSITFQVGLVFVGAAVLGVVTEFSIALVIWMVLAGLAALLGFL